MTVAFVAPSASGELGLPIDCVLGKTCFVQQLPDMDLGPGVADPWCGQASYDGHDGTDIRLRSMLDEARGLAVIAVADGEVLRTRDGVPDKLVQSPEDADRIANIECGNGLVIDHGDGLEAQYCHLKMESLAVSPGDTVRKGDVLGEVGASGMTQFPHVHVTITKDGVEIDPSTGRALSDGCATGSQAAPVSYWDAATAPLFTDRTDAIIGHGFTDAALDHEDLVIHGAPPAPSPDSPAIVGWAWMINLRAGDSIELVLTGPDGAVVAENVIPPLESSKATYSAYTGKRGAPEPGTYALAVTVRGQDGRVLTAESALTLR